MSIVCLKKEMFLFRKCQSNATEASYAQRTQDTLHPRS